MAATNRIRTISLTTAALVLVAALSSGCGPTKSATVSAAPATGTKTTNTSVVVPQESLPPLPGAMSGGSPQPEATVSPGNTPGDADATSGATTK